MVSSISLGIFRFLHQSVVILIKRFFEVIFHTCKGQHDFVSIVNIFQFASQTSLHQQKNRYLFENMKIVILTPSPNFKNKCKVGCFGLF